MRIAGGLVFGIVLLWGAGMAQGQVATAAGGVGNGAGTQAASQPAETKTMRFEFRDAPLDAILNEMVERFGLTILKPGPVPGRITVNVPEPLNKDQAVKLLNSLLMTQGYALIEVHMEGVEEKLLRVGTVDEMRKRAPVIGIK